MATTPGTPESAGEFVPAVDLFSGPGGWDIAAAELGIVTIGIEYDAAACRTRAAAGHLTIRADVAKYDPHRFAGFAGCIASPPCPTFSAAGKGAGNAVLHVLADAIRDEFAGHRRLARHTRTMARLLRRERIRSTKCTRAQGAAWAWRQARMSALVVQPARWSLAIKPRWIAMEQVPPVLPLWQVYATELRALGYSVWCGVLNAADYGVPQTRKRAILTASLDRQVTCPEPTHAQRPTATLWGEPEPWVSMATALGWGMTERPMPTVTGGGTAAGGAEPIARGGRALLERERGGGVVALTERQRNGSVRLMDEPAMTITAAADNGNFRWAYRRTRGGGLVERSGDRPDTPMDKPAPTLTSKARSDVWVVDRRTNSKGPGGGIGANGARSDG